MNLGSTLGHVLGSFWEPFWSPNRSQNYTPKKKQLRGSLLDPFFEILKLFKCFLGASLSPVCSSWGGPLGSIQNSKNIVFGMQNNTFRKYCFSGYRCHSCVHLVASYPVLTPKRLPKWPQNETQNQTTNC